MTMLGYVFATPRFPAKPQIERLKSVGVQERHIWTEGSGTESWPELLKAVRKGDVLAVDGLHRLGTSREAIHRAMMDASLKGAQILDAANNVQANAAAFASVAEAFRVLAGEQRMPTHSEAVRRGKQGGAPGHREKRTRENKRIWLMADSNEEASCKIGVPWRTLYRWWGASGRPAGWPKPKK